MSVIVDVTTDANDFTVGRALAAGRDVTIELEALVPLRGGAAEYVRVRGVDDPVTFGEHLAAHPAVDDVTPVGDDETSQLYRVEWAADAIDGVLAAVRDNDGQVLSASARDGRWRFTFRFPDSAALAACQRATTGDGTALDVGRIYAAADGTPDPDHGLTEPQRDALVKGVEAGYFRVPREISAAELGTILGVSDQAVSERIRRGVERLVRNTLDVPDDRN